MGPPFAHTKSIHSSYLIWQKEFADMTKLRISRWGDYSGSPKWVQNAITSILIRENQKDI